MSEEQDDIASAAVDGAGGVATDAAGSAVAGDDPSEVAEVAASGAVAEVTHVADAAIGEAVPEEAGAAAGLATSVAGAAASQSITDPSKAAGAAASAAAGGIVGSLAKAAEAGGVPAIAAAVASSAVASLAQGAIQSALSSSEPPAATSSSATHHAGFQAPTSVSGAADEVVEFLSSDDEGHVAVFFDCPDMNASFDVLGLEWTETLNEPFSCRIKLATEDMELELGRFLGADCSLGLVRNDQEQRLLGICADVTEGASSAHRAEIRLTIVPALQLLSLRRDTRIFQDKTVPEILAEVLADALGGFGRSHQARLDRDYPKCEYRVQYDETDLAFVQRLMGEEGIVYWFDHEGDAEELVLVDDPERHPLVDRPLGETLDVRGFEAGHGNLEVIREFHRTGQMRPTSISLRHWSWSQAQRLVTEAAGEPPPEEELPDGAASGPPREEYEHDDQPLTLYGYSKPSYAENDKTDQGRLRRERQRQDASIGRGHATVMAMRAGTRFSLSGHRAIELDGDYMLFSVTHHFHPGGQPESDHKDPYYNTFECLPLGVSFRPKRIRKPAINGVQTATVVGPSGDEIHTDEHGRIRVQFHWDRHGELNAKSSCYLRVMQAWAGPGWGFMFLPRVGMEVMITFVSGDPDRPIVTGSLYNLNNTPPYPLPANKTMSSIKTSSSPGGDGYNELTFEDAAGEEQIIVHAQKDYNETIEHDHSTTVHNNQTVTVDANQTETVGGDQTITVKSNQVETVKENVTITVEGTREETVTKAEIIHLLDVRERYVGKTEFHQVTDAFGEQFDGGRDTVVSSGDDREEITSGKKTVNVVAGSLEMAGKTKVTLIQNEGHSLVLEDGAILQTSADFSVTNGKSTVKSTGGKLEVTAADELSLVCGAASITLKKDGTVEIVGSKSASLGTPGGKFTAEPAGATINGPKITSQAIGIHEIMGALVKIN